MTEFKIEPSLVVTRDGDEVVFTYQGHRTFRITRDELVVDTIIDQADLEIGALEGWWKDGCLRLEIDGEEITRMSKFQQVHLAEWVDNVPERQS